MKNIPFEKIKECVIGTQYIEKTTDTLAFHRMPNAILPFYDSEPAMIRVQCTAGVRIRFLSDTTSIELRVKYGKSARSIFQGSLIVDSDIYPWGPEMPESYWHGKIFQCEEKRERLFDLWLPHLCKTELVSISIDEQADFTPPPPLKYRWLALGDSITQGMTATLPTRTHYGIISLSINAECYNFGVGGAVFDKRIAPYLPDANLNFVVISYGTNDFAHSVPLNLFVDNANILLSQTLEKYHIPVYLITPITWVDHPEKNEAGISLHQYRDVLVETASSISGINIIDGTTMIPDDSIYFVDKVHPNNRGFASYATNFLTILNKSMPFLSQK